MGGLTNKDGERKRPIALQLVDSRGFHPHQKSGFDQQRTGHHGVKPRRPCVVVQNPAKCAGTW